MNVASAPAVASLKPSPSVAAAAASNAPTADDATAWTSFGEPETCVPASNTRISYVDAAVSGVQTPVYEPSPLSVRVTTGATTTPAASTTAAKNASPPTRRAFPYASFASTENVAGWPTVSIVEVTTSVEREASVAAGSTATKKGLPEMKPMSSASPPLSATRTESVPETVVTYFASYRPLVAFHAAEASAAAIDVTLPLSHVASEPPLTMAASRMTCNPDSSASSRLP